MGKIITFTNQKGGVSKTTSAHAVASELAHRGFRILVIDFDPSANISKNSRADISDCPTVLEWVVEQAEFEEVVQHIDYKLVNDSLDYCEYDIVPAPEKRRLKHDGFIQMLRQLSEPLYALKTQIEKIRDQYDYIIIDTGPDLDLVPLNALYAADELIVVTTINKNAMDAIEDLADAINDVREDRDDFIVRGILVTQYRVIGTIYKDQNADITEAAKMVDCPVFKTFIRASLTVEEATRNRLDIMTYSTLSLVKNKNISEDYKAFVTEYLEGESK